MLADARSEIENTLYRNAWAYDACDLAGVGECFARDAQVEFPDTGVLIGREAIRLEMQLRREAYAEGCRPWHVISAVYVETEGEAEAVVRSRYTFFLVDADGSHRRLAIGWYADVLVREDDAWRIKRRRVLSPSDE